MQTLGEEITPAATEKFDFEDRDESILFSFLNQLYSGKFGQS